MPITSLNAFEQGKQWPPESENARLKRYRQNQQLFEGDHDKVWKDSTRALRPELLTVQRFVLNVHRRLTTHWADLVLGEAPAITAGEENSREQRALERIVNEAALHNVAYEVALDRSQFGDGVFKIRLEAGRAIIEGQPPEYWFPVVSPNNVRKYEAHVLGWTFKARIGVLKQERDLVRLEIHTRGKIEHRIHLLKDGRLGPDYTSELLEGQRPVEETGVDDFLIVQVPGLRTTRSVHGRDDYSDLDTLVHEMEDRIAQMSRILDKHADPALYGPESALEFNEETGRWQFRKEGYLVVDSKDDPVPGYLTWDGDLASALSEFNLLFDQMLFIAETSPAAFGLLKAGLAESGSALKRLMLADLAKASRITRSFDRALKHVLTVAAQLERRNGRRDTPEIPEISIDWRDGLPDDPTENSQIAERGVREGFMSRYSAISLMHPDWRDSKIQEELDRIREDQAETAGSVPGASPPSRILGAELERQLAGEGEDVG